VVKEKDDEVSKKVYLEIKEKVENLEEKVEKIEEKVEKVEKIEEKDKN